MTTYRDKSVDLGPTGSFNHAALASGRRFDAAEFLSDEPILGLQREAGYMWGTLRDDDDVLYSVMRRIAPPGAAQGDGKSLGGKLLVVSSGTEKGQLQLRREPRGAVDSNDVKRHPDGEDAVRLASVPGAPGRTMELVLSENEFSYTEENVLDVTGKIVVPPLQWYLPGAESSLLYLSHTWLVDGQLLGKPVRGFLFWEEAWMPPGGQLYVEKDPLLDAEYLTWYSWANKWDDGSFEVGHFLFGPGVSPFPPPVSDGDRRRARTRVLSSSRNPRWTKPELIRRGAGRARGSAQHLDQRGVGLTDHESFDRLQVKAPVSLRRNAVAPLQQFDQLPVGALGGPVDRTLETWRMGGDEQGIVGVDDLEQHSGQHGQGGAACAFDDREVEPKAVVRERLLVLHDAVAIGEQILQRAERLLATTGDHPHGRYLDLRAGLIHVAERSPLVLQQGAAVPRGHRTVGF
jgi:hypothetical protein